SDLPPCGRRPWARGAKGREMTSMAERSSGGDAGSSVPDDRLHPVFGHQLQLLQLADPPLPVRRDRARSLERRQLLIVGAMLPPETPELPARGHRPFDEGLLAPSRPPFA